MKFEVRYPLLWLTLAAIIVYFPTLSYGLTDLDDGIFINTFHEYNEDVSNLITSFQRGLFDAVKDKYYRPLFSDSMILNYLLSNDGQNIMLYHAFNLIFHIAAVLLLYTLLKKLRVRSLHAFILSLVFAVHPVLSMAVAWIPGRNDTMLAICVLSFLIFSIDYAQTGKWKFLLLSALFLTLAFFTKETAIAAIPVAAILLVFVLEQNWRSRASIIQYGVWMGCFAIWLITRSFATLTAGSSVSSQMLHDFIHNMPAVIQYLGKIFLPFNLSVYPSVSDTVYYYGITSIALLLLSLFLYKKRDIKVALAGICIFLLLLLPALLVPDYISHQTFEHRLYLPMIGILLLLSQTSFFHNRLTDKAMLGSGIAVAAVFAVINFSYQKNFSDPLSFWSNAAKTSPHSAYANMMLAARTGDPQESEALFLKAYELNPNERFLNFIYGFRLQSKDSVLASEKYFLTEKKNTGYYACDFYLARVAMEKKDYTGAIAYLEAFLKKEPKHPLANNNLLFLYIDTGHPDKAKALAKQMMQLNIEVPKDALNELKM